MGQKEMHAAFARIASVVDEGSLASIALARALLRIADVPRVPRVVLVGDEKELDAVYAGKPFAQLQRAGMQTAVMGKIKRQPDPALEEPVEVSLSETGSAPSPISAATLPRCSPTTSRGSPRAGLYSRPKPAPMPA